MDWECIIVNDGSTDSTETIALKWTEKDARFIYNLKKNGGLSSARNSGLAIANGEFIQFLDSDDCIGADKFQSSIDLLNSNKEISVIVSNYKRFTDTLSKAVKVNYFLLGQDLLNYENVLLKWDDEFAIPIHCGFFKSDFFKNFRFNEVLKAKEDWVMWISFFQNKHKALFLDEDFAFYRINLESMTKSKDIFPDYINSIHYLKTILNSEDFDRLLLQIIQRQHNFNKKVKNQVSELKSMKFYKAFIFYKKVGLKLNKIFKSSK
jgi:hypothetical protein